MKKIFENKAFKNIIASLVFIILLSLVILRTNTIFQMTFNHSYFIDQRREQADNMAPEDMDIIYIGGSKVSAGLIPIEIWKNTGLKGINLATNTQPPVATKFLLKKYARELKPKYILMEPSGILTDSSLEKSAAYRYPMSLQFLNSYWMSKLLLDDLSRDYPDESSLEYRYPIYRDHSRWKSLSKRDFVFIKEYDDFKLGFTNDLAIKDKKISLEDKLRYNTYDENPGQIIESERHYQEIVDFAKELDIEVIILTMPDIYGIIERTSRMKLFAEQNHLKYINFSIDPVFDTLSFENRGDFYDRGHLSLTGAMKFSKKLSEVLIDLLDLEVVQEDAKYSEYYADFMKYFEDNQEKYTQYYK